MTKEQLVEAVAAKLGIPKTQSAEALNTFIDEITKALKKGDKVIITGFGIFKVIARKARVGINPRTGEKVQIPASKAPKFRAGKAFKEAFN